MYGRRAPGAESFKPRTMLIRQALMKRYRLRGGALRDWGSVTDGRRLSDNELLIGVGGRGGFDSSSGVETPRASGPLYRVLKFNLSNSIAVGAFCKVGAGLAIRGRGSEFSVVVEGEAIAIVLI